MRIFRLDRMAAVLVFVGIGVTVAQMPKGFVKAGSVALSDGDAVTWGVSGQSFSLWRVHAGVWTWMHAPDGLVKTLDDQLADGDFSVDDLGENPPFHVEVRGHSLVLFWVNDLPNDSDPDVSSIAVHRATSSDLGRHWDETNSVVKDVDAEEIERFSAADAQHAMLIAAGEGGLGNATRFVLGTNDGGVTWRLLVDQNAKIPLIGRSGDIIMKYVDPMHAWIVSACDPCEGEPEGILHAAQTSNGGRTWAPAAITKLETRYKDDLIVGSQFNARHAANCFDTEVYRQEDNGSDSKLGLVHYCTADAGRSWTGPVPGASR